MVWGAPFSAYSRKILLLASGELGNEFHVENARETAKHAASLLKVEEFDHEQ
ncbi:hypothetical protein ACP8HI_11165 [Paenibacillus sp. FA6]|uniref:hypothetical protein n=1 Tax=Paenibacillus sp. FA6 TaxID=3413029 RepID=UPI003F65E061